MIQQKKAKNPTMVRWEIENDDHKTMFVQRISQNRVQVNISRAKGVLSKAAARGFAYEILKACE